MTLLKTLAIAATGLMLSFGAVQAAEGQKPAKDISFSFEGPFGTFDRAAAQRGFQIYAQVCAACHSMRLVAYRRSRPMPCIMRVWLNPKRALTTVWPHALP